MIVMKFGGTSIENVSACERVIRIIANHSSHKPVVVFSAMGKITRKLLNLAEYSAYGKRAENAEIFRDIKLYHLQMAEDLCSGAIGKKLRFHLRSYFKDMNVILKKVEDSENLSGKLQDRVLSFGELFSTSIMAAAMEERNLTVELLDSRSLIITDDLFSIANPDYGITNRNICTTVNPILKQKKIPIIQGFIASTRQGETTTLGFEGSDFTASMLGAALGADEIQIWKDVPGIMTADPLICNDVFTVEKISFKEAAELSKAGAKVLHPRTTGPAEKNGIVIKIKNSKCPDDEGTLISRFKKSNLNRVKSIVCRRPVYYIRIVMVNSQLPEVEEKLLITLNDIDLNYKIVEKKQNEILIAVSGIIDNNSIIEQLSVFGGIDISNEKAEVSLIGEGVKKNENIQEIIETSLKDISFKVEIDDNPDKYTIIVDDKNIEISVKCLHAVLYDH